MPVTEDSKELVQSHIDKLFSNLQRAWDVRGRFLIATTIISIILIGISSGALSEISDISAGGLNAKVSVTVLICVGIFGVTVLFGALVTIDLYTDKIRDEIVRLYNSIGYHDDALLDRERTPLEGPNVIHAAIHSGSARQKGSHWFIRANDILGTIMVIVVLFLLPIGAQIAGSVWLAAQYSWHWIPITGALVCILTTGLIIVSSVMQV